MLYIFQTFTNINISNTEKIYLEQTHLSTDKNTYPKHIFYKTNFDWLSPLPEVSRLTALFP